MLRRYAAAAAAAARPAKAMARAKAAAKAKGKAKASSSSRSSSSTLIGMISSTSGGSSSTRLANTANAVASVDASADASTVADAVADALALMDSDAIEATFIVQSGAEAFVAEVVSERHLQNLIDKLPEGMAYQVIRRNCH